MAGASHSFPSIEFPPVLTRFFSKGIGDGQAGQWTNRSAHGMRQKGRKPQKTGTGGTIPFLF
jgi:hypothetical protein